MKAKIFIFILLITPIISHAGESSDNWKHFSDAGAYGLVAVSWITPGVKKDKEGFKQAFYSVATASAIGLVGKLTIDEKRPDLTSNDSFPSNHTANSFAAATTMYRRYGWKYGAPAYVVASLVGNGRVRAHRHHWRDVLAGALLGTSSGWYFTDKFEATSQIGAWWEDNRIGLSYALKW